MHKRLISVLFLSIILILNGCNNNTKPAVSTTQKAESGLKQSASSTLSQDATSPEKKKIVNAGVDSSKSIQLIKKQNKTKYILTNGIVVNNVVEAKEIPSKYGKVHVAIPEMKGLVNKDLENKINLAIANDIKNAFKDFPARLETEEAYYYCERTLNANNLLCLSVNQIYTPPTYGFLYRLTDGKRLHLKDIFTEGTDYVSLLNKYVNESLIGKEEDYLSEPFTTILPDQGFVLSPSTLSLIFPEGECGFAQKYVAEIPLSQIDDYVNVMDIYSGTERKTHTHNDLIVRNNNIFLATRGDVIPQKNGKLWTHYFEVSGLWDDAFEKEVNSVLKKGIQEIVGGHYFDNLQASTEPGFERLAAIEMYACFNHYGILCVNRSINAFGSKGNTDFSSLHKIYTFDLLKKKQINAADIIKSYFKKNKEAEQQFTQLVKEQLNTASPSASDYNTFIAKNVNFDFLVRNGTISFVNSFEGNDIQISISFKNGTFPGVSDETSCSVPLKSVSAVAPEEFFAY